jgi:opacity protein-like surface antigen
MAMSFDEKVFDTSNKAGWFIGPTLQVSLPVGGLGFDISAFYDQKGAEINGESITQKSILIPVNARLKFGLGGAAGIYAAVGPQFGFNVGDDKYTWKSLGNISGTQEQINNEFQLKKSSFSVNLGAGVYLSDHFEVGFVYNIALGKTADASFDQGVKAVSDDTKAKSWQISAAYFF